MLSWAEAGKHILATDKRIGKAERAAMGAHIKAVELAGAAFSNVEPVVRSRSKEVRAVSEAFTKLYPQHADSGFSYDLKRTLALDAVEEATRFNHNYIGTEHLLLALTREGNPTVPILNSFGVDPEKTRSAVEFIIGRGEKAVSSDDIGLTPRAKKTVELAIEESRRLKDKSITSEHLFLALVREGEGIAAGVLESMGVSLDKVRQAVMRHRAEK